MACGPPLDALRHTAGHKPLKALSLNKFLIMDNLLQCITLYPEVCKGKPTVRNMRFTVAQLLELLAAGMTQEEILADYPYLEKEDILACLIYAAKMADAKTVFATAA